MKRRWAPPHTPVGVDEGAILIPGNYLLTYVVGRFDASGIGMSFYMDVWEYDSL